jgi:hypothetical protein
MSISHNQTENNISNAEKILIQKKNLCLSRIIKNKYQLDCIIENTNIYLDKIINFQFIKLMYEANKNYFEVIQLDIVNDNEAYLYLLVKPILKELGIVQRYISLKLTKYVDTAINKIYFKGVSFPEYGKKINECKNAVLSPIYEINIVCTIIHSHKIQIQQTFLFEDKFVSPPLFETIFAKMLKDIFKQIIKVIEYIT